MLERFQNVHLKFLDAPDHLQNHLASVDDTETTSPSTPNSQDYLQRNILLGLGEIAMSIYVGGSSGRYVQATIDKIKNNLHILQQKIKFAK